MGWTTVATDNFNRANQNPLAGNWSTAPSSNAMQLESNTVYGTVNASFNVAYWNANSFNNDQYSFATRVTGNAKFLRVHGRINTSSGINHYTFTHTPAGTTGYLNKTVAGSETTIGSTFTTANGTAGNKFRLEIQGTSLMAYSDTGGGWNLDATRTDSAHSSGAAGLGNYDITGSGAWDDWEGGHWVADAGGTQSISVVSRGRIVNAGGFGRSTSSSLVNSGG